MKQRSGGLCQDTTGRASLMNENEAKLNRLLDAADEHNRLYTCNDVETFVFILRKGGQIGEIENVPYGDKGFKTQCQLHWNGRGTYYFSIFTRTPVDWE